LGKGEETEGYAENDPKKRVIFATSVSYKLEQPRKETSAKESGGREKEDVWTGEKESKESTVTLSWRIEQRQKYKTVSGEKVPTFYQLTWGGERMPT